MAVGSLVGGWLGWWGLGGTSLRRGSRTMVRGLAPSGIPAALVVALCLGAAVALGLLAWQGGDLVSWWPLTPGGSLLDLLDLLDLLPRLQP